MEPKVDTGTVQRVDPDLETELTTQSRKIKQDLRYGKMLQRKAERDSRFAESLPEWQFRILQEAKDGTLKRKANTAVVQAGRGRLRGDNDDDYVDIGTNRDRGVVTQILDGKRPKQDLSRFKFD